MTFRISKSVKRFSAAIAFVALSAGAAKAQQEYVGQWSCNMSFTEFDNSGNRSGGFTMAFGILIQADGSFYAEGQEQSVIGVHPFQAQGGWGLQNGARGLLFFANGQKSSPAGGGPFGFVAFMGPQNRRLVDVNEGPNPQTGGVLNRTATECIRTG